MKYVLNLGYLTFITLLSPYLIYACWRKGKYREGLSHKLLGLVPNLNVVPERIWFHAVSVGEVNLIASLLGPLRQQRPDVDVVISSTTKTGYHLAREKYPTAVVVYCPLDFSWAVRSAFRRIKPTLLVLMELELWPNLLTEAARCQVPVVIANGRLGDRSMRGYRRLRPLMQTWLAGVKGVAAQSRQCGERFVELGIRQENVFSVGSLKFDGVQTDRKNPQTNALCELFQVEADDVVWVAGSTQAPEESMAISIFEKLVAEFPKLRLVLVPRHPERGDSVAKLLDASRIAWQRRSMVAARPSTLPPKVLLVDTVGELGSWWGRADVGFVGGSFGNRGGQNMLEPAGFGVATCFGPNTWNFRDIVEKLTACDGARVVTNEDELEDFVRECIANPLYRHSLGDRARALVKEHRGAARKTVELLLTHLGDQSRQSVHRDGLPACDSELFPRKSA